MNPHTNYVAVGLFLLIGTIALVGLIMGSQSDWETMKKAADLLSELAIPHEVKVVSAHRTPDLMFEYPLPDQLIDEIHALLH